MMRTNKQLVGIACALIFLGCIILPGCGATTQTPNKYFAKCSPIEHVELAPRQVGSASWYGKRFHGCQTASGEVYDMYKLTAAHKTLPFGSIVRVVNLCSNKGVVVRINDRGPFAKDRIIDLSFEAAKSCGLIIEGTSPVIVELIHNPEEIN
ncbi:MAG: hypothetical protein B6244_13295 [Candidatus Cloacimonetes bacterium 4572_55]|nr:MAG: hypothetical protein B6244_13295 [Candidatus Cloacimonetes bacterium 4572_55]